MPSAAFAQIAARSGLDCVVVDMEHGPIDLQTAHSMIAATAGTQCTPLVRLPWTQHWLAKPVLDAGAYGLVFPMIGEAALARETVRAIRYPPQGERGLAPAYASLRWGVTLPEYLRGANDALINAIIIEHPDAITRLDEIIAIEGIDLVLIATYDLSMALGSPGQRDHPELLRLVDEAERKLRTSGKAFGGVVFSAEDAREKISRGYQFLVVGYDVPVLQRSLTELANWVPKP